MNIFFEVLSYHFICVATFGHLINVATFAYNALIVYFVNLTFVCSNRFIKIAIF